MKKSLSVLLSLLMVVSCMTCLFTMPASAVETPEAQSSGESLPTNLITNETKSGTDLFVAEDSVKAGEYYQLDFTYTAESTDALYPSFVNGEAAVSNVEMVGIRYQAATPGYIETVYNYATVVDAANAAESVVGTEYNYTYIISADAAFTSISLGANVTNANLFALADTDWDNYVWDWDRTNYRVVRFMVQEGDNVFQRMYGYRVVGDTSVTNVQNGVPALYVTAKVGGDYYDLYLKGGYDYAYDINTRVPTGAQNPLVRYTGIQYGIMETKLENLDWVDEYNEFKAKYGFEADTENGFYNRAANWYDEATGQMYFNESANGYMYFYNASGTATTSRRPTAGEGEIAWVGDTTMTNDGTKFFTRTCLTFADGNSYFDWFSNWNQNNNISKVFPNCTDTSPTWLNEWATYSATTNFGYGLPGYVIGGNATQTIPVELWNDWFNLYAVYPTDLATGQDTVEDVLKAAAATGSAYGTSNLRYSYNASTGEFVQNTASNNIIIPATDNAYVALSMGNMYPGYTYDFEPMAFGAINETLDAPSIVKGKDSNGVEKDIHANDNTTAVSLVSYDSMANEVKVSFTYDATHEAYGDFVGWFVDDECLSTEMNATLPYDKYDASKVRAVVEYENYLGEAGGFESYTSSTNLVLPNKEVTATNGNDTITLYAHDGTPTGDKWGIFTNNFWSKVDGYYIPDGYTCDDPYTTEQGAFANRGQQVYVHTGAWSGVTAQYGKNYVRLISATSQAVKAIEGLTPGKQYVVSFYTYVPTTGNGVGGVSIGNNVVDIYNGVARTNTRGSKVYTQASALSKDNQTNSPDGWRKLTMYFTPDQETVYLGICFSSSSACVDSFLCQEVKEDTLPTSWNFEDGNVAPLGFINSSEKYDYSTLAAGTNGTAAVVDATDSDPAKVGNKYFTINAGTSGNNFASANFYYNGTDKYVISFDMKMINYASAEGSKLEMFTAKSNGTGHAVISYLATNTAVLYSGQTVTRYYEDGKAFKRAISPNSSSSHYMFTTRTENDRLYFGEQNGGDLWDEWAHWEIEIDPSQDNGYEGFVTFGWHLNTSATGAILGLDNIKVEKYSTTDINAAKDNFNGTYAFNIRNKVSATIPQGLRFKNSVDLDVVDSLGEGSKIVEYGTLAATNQAYWNGAALGEKLLRANAKDTAKDGYAIAGVAYNRETGKDVRYSIDEETNVVTFTGVLIGIADSQLDTEFVVRGYVIIEDAKGMRTVVYGDIQTISMISAATAVVANPNTPEDAAAAQEVIDAYNAYNGIE